MTVQHCLLVCHWWEVWDSDCESCQVLAIVWCNGIDGLRWWMLLIQGFQFLGRIDCTQCIDVAYCYRLVCLLGTRIGYAKTAEAIKMTFGGRLM